MWPFTKKPENDYSDYVGIDKLLNDSKVALTHNEKVAVDFGLKLLASGSANPNSPPLVHPNATAILRATAAGSLVAYAIYVIRRASSVANPVEEIVGAFDKAFLIYPNRSILEEKGRWLQAVKLIEKQTQVQNQLDSLRTPMTERAEVFSIMVKDVGRSLEGVEVKKT